MAMAERYFSALWTIKTCLLSAMDSTVNVMLMHSQKDKTDVLDLTAVANDF